jgi:hypothetical protein
MEIYSQGLEDMMRQANVVKDTVLEALEKEGLLKKPAKEIGEQYAVVIHKRGWLGHFMAKWFGDGEAAKSLRVNMVKVL